jgi:hypothetical protein
MTAFELEVAANAAAREILRLEHQAGSTAADQHDFNLVFSSARRSRMLDAIVRAIEQSFSVHVLASSESGPSPEVESVRHAEAVPAGLQQTRHWRSLRHAFDSGGATTFWLLRPCLRCGMPEYFGMHFLPSEPLQPCPVERTDSDEARIRGEAKP